MIRWVVTGPIGAGKSTVTGILADRGAVVVDADQLGHEILALPEVVAEIVQVFGPAVAPGGKVDRQLLGPLVFADPEARRRLNAITHGRISDLAAKRLVALEMQGKNDKLGKHKLAVLEAAVYFLFPSPPAVDLVISVLAGPDVRASRLAASRGLTAEQARERLAAQSDLDQYWSQADAVLDNSGDLDDLRRQIDNLWAKYLPA